jgi:hypothetical protein
VTGEHEPANLAIDIDLTAPEEASGGEDPRAQGEQGRGPRHSRRHSGLRGAFADQPPGLGPGWRRVLVSLLAFQIVMIGTLGVVTALRFHYWSIIDEEAHFSYVQDIAQHGALPVLGKTETSLQGLAIEQGIYPKPTTINPKTDGLGGLSYEAFQPPLYYISAVPAFDLTGNYRDKIYAIRLYGVLLLMVSVLLIARLCRVVLKERWLIGWAVTLVFFILPGVIVRFATISYLPLVVPLAILFTTELWIAWHRHSRARLMVAGALAGLCVLTELEMVVLLPVFALVVAAEAYRARSVRRMAPLAVAVAIPIVIMAPWFLFNEAHYHALTAGHLAIKEQTAIINPTHQHFSIGQLPNDTVENIFQPTIALEWGAALAGHPALGYLDTLLDVLMVPASLVLILSLGRRLWSIPTAILALPWGLIVVEMWYIRYGEQWLIFNRYTYAALPILLVLVADATDTFRARYLPVLVGAGATVSALVIWSYFLFVYTGLYTLK